MTDQELETLLNDLESDRAERKESISDGDKIRQAICAFANDLPDYRQPGVLFIGADNRGEGVALPITDQLLITLSNMRSDGNILAELDELLKINVQATVDFTSGPIEVQRPDYPLVALQQITRNAVLHRSYENTNAPVRLYWFRDRVEVQNPGAPYGQVTRANFGTPGAYDYRNPNLAAVMKDLGYVQRFGMGIAMARQAMATNGNPAPEFQVEDTHIAVILRRRP